MHIAQRAKSDYYDYYEADVSAPLPEDDEQYRLGGTTPPDPPATAGLSLAATSSSPAR